MSKNWFVIEKDFHRGPFSFEELKGLVHHGKVKSFDLVWKEGLSKPIPFSELEKQEIVQLESLIPDIPKEAELPSLDDLKGVPAFVQLPKQDSLDIEYKLENDIEKKVQKTPFKKIITVYFSILVAIAFIVLLASYWFYRSKQVQLDYPQTMGSSDYERLSTVVSKARDKTFSYEVALSKTMDEVWIATNYPGQAKVKLEFYSYPDKTLELKEIKGESIGELKNYLITFNQFSVFNNQKWLPGYYHFRIKFLENSGLSPFDEYYFGKKAIEDFEFDIFYGQGDFAEFLKKLGTKKVEEKIPLESPEVLVLREKEEKLRTILNLMTTVEQSTQELHQTFLTEKPFGNKKQVRLLLASYEKKYTEEVAPLLTTLSYDLGVDLTKKFAAHFIKHLEEIKKLGLKKLKNTNKFESFSRETFIEFKENISVIETELKKVEEEIQRLKAQSGP